MVLVRLTNNEVNKVFEVPVVKRYLYVYGARALVYNYEVVAMKNYLENKFKVNFQEKVKIGNMIDVPNLNQISEIIEIKAKKCILRLQMLVATMSFQLK